MTLRQERIEKLRNEIARMERSPGSDSSAIYAMYKLALDERRRKLEQLEQEESLYQQGYEDGLKQSKQGTAGLKGVHNN